MGNGTELLSKFKHPQKLIFVSNQAFPSQSHQPISRLTGPYTHVLLPGHMLAKGARSFEVTVNLAVGKEKARCWRNEVYAEDRAHPLLPLGRLANLLDAKFYGEHGEAFMQCRNKGQWRTVTKVEMRNDMAYPEVPALIFLDPSKFFRSDLIFLIRTAFGNSNIWNLVRNFVCLSCNLHSLVFVVQCVWTSKGMLIHWSDVTCQDSCLRPTNLTQNYVFRKMHVSKSQWCGVWCLKTPLFPEDNFKCKC